MAYQRFPVPGDQGLTNGDTGRSCQDLKLPETHNEGQPN